MLKFLSIGVVASALTIMAVVTGCGSTATGNLTIKGAGGSSVQASDPGTLKVKIYKVAFSESEFCTNLQTVFERASGDATYQDFLTSPNIAENASLADGTYKCVVIEFSDTLIFTTTVADGSCSANTEYTIDVCRTGSGDSTLIDGSTVTCDNTDNRIGMYISTASTETTGTNGHTAFQAPTTASDSTKGFLLSSAFVKAGAKTGTFVVNGSGKVDGSNSTCDFQPPLFSFE